MMPIGPFADRHPRAGLVGRPRAKQRLMLACPPQTQSKEKAMPA